MSGAFSNPALESFLAALGQELIFGQVWIRRRGAGFELRHESDRNEPDLRAQHISQIRAQAQVTESGHFRPLKSAPTLARGWRLQISGPDELLFALDVLYPGSVADWYAAQQTPPPATSYREFTGRQTGMYGPTALLEDQLVGEVARACCHPESCLKRRWWTGPGLAAEEAAKKSLIPCLEPCALLLDFARTVGRWMKEPPAVLSLRADEMASILAALRHQGLTENPEGRDADFSAPENPRRCRLVAERLETAWQNWKNKYEK